MAETASAPTYRPSSNTRGRGHGCSYGSQMQCQLCRKMSHLVDRCCHRFDSPYKSIDYGPLGAPQANLSMLGSTCSMPPWMPTMSTVNPNSQSGWYNPPVSAPNWTNPFVPHFPQHGTMSSPASPTVPQAQAYAETPATVANNA